MTGSSTLFRKASAPISQPGNLYERFGLTQNPFPDRPGVVWGSGDPRLNGSIYRADLRQQEQLTFERLLIPNTERPEVRPMAFLMDYTTRRGRGIGKTAFLTYQCRRIMADLGDAVSGGSYVLAAAYILPPGEGKCRKFWQFAQTVAEALNDQAILARAMWRLRAFSGCIPDSVLSRVGNDAQETIGNDDWLRRQGVDVDFGLDRVIQRVLEAGGVQGSMAPFLARSGHSPELFRRDFLDRQTEYRWRQEGGRWVFDDLAYTFQVAGFNRDLFLVDEVEKIVAHQNTKERRTFVEDLRYFLIDGPYQSARSGLYALLLTIHPYVQELLAPHWNAAGMDRFCPLSGELAPQYTIYFHSLETEAAVPLVMEYLDLSRTSPSERGRLTPFEQPAVVEALRLTKGVPGPMLALLRRVIEKAVEQGWETIGAQQVQDVFQVEVPTEPEDRVEEESLPPAQVNLQSDE